MSKNIIIGLVLAVIWASSLALFGKHQYDMGVQITESAWNKKENDELKAANAEIVKLRDALVKAEAEKATALAEATKTYQEKEKRCSRPVSKEPHGSACSLVAHVRPRYQ